MQCFVSYNNRSVNFLIMVNLFFSTIVTTKNIWPTAVLLKVVLVQKPEATATSDI